MAANYPQAADYARKRLTHELAPTLLFHSLAHTELEVLPAALRFARMEAVDDEALMLLSTAAWFHDVGYVEQRQEHETVSAAIAGSVLPNMGYSADQVSAVQGMIMATRLPQSPNNLLEQLLADADLSVLGHTEFLARNQDLRTELASAQIVYSDREWYSSQLRFLESHRYFTHAAQSLNDVQKAQNVALMTMLLESS